MLYILWTFMSRAMVPANTRSGLRACYPWSKFDSETVSFVGWINLLKYVIHFMDIHVPGYGPSEHSFRPRTMLSLVQVWFRDRTLCRVISQPAVLELKKIFLWISIKWLYILTFFSWQVILSIKSSVQLSSGVQYE